MRAERRSASDLLVEARRRAGISQAELGRRSGVAPSLIGRYERYEVIPSIERLCELLCDLDLCFTPAGTRGYDDLRREASRERLGRGLVVTVASLRDVIRSKEAAGRDKDLAQLPLLRRTLELVAGRAFRSLAVRAGGPA